LKKIACDDVRACRGAASAEFAYSVYVNAV